MMFKSIVPDNEFETHSKSKMFKKWGVKYPRALLYIYINIYIYECPLIYGLQFRYRGDISPTTW